MTKNHLRYIQSALILLCILVNLTTIWMNMLRGGPH